jgi:type I restriction enzyme S subunit
MADLQAAGQQLERYRLSVLQAAVEGRLTADWRRTHDPEPADQLLERILEERKKKWYKSRYKDPGDPEFGDHFPESPEGWTVTSFDSVLSHVTSGPRGWSDYYHEGDGVFILAQNVNPWKLDLSETKNVNPPSDASGRDRAMVQKDDLLVTIVGANTGDVCRVDRQLDEHWVCQSVALMRPALPATCKYLEVYLNSQLGQRQYERFAYGQGRPHLNFGQLKATPLLLPPLSEQKQIVDEVERLLSVADDAAATAERERTRAERLRQSILKQAFSGRLVPHDEDTEPPAIEASSSNGTGQDSSGATGSPSNGVSSSEDDVGAEELYNGSDPGKQIEMDL